MPKIVYVEGNAGASGDMFLSALIDLGFPAEKLNEIFEKLPIRVKAARVKRGGLSAMRVGLVGDRSQIRDLSPRHSLAQFISRIEKCRVGQEQKKKAAKIIHRLAEAEGAIHGKPAERIHFHEIGGWDTILDVVGVVAGLNHLRISKISVGPLQVGNGWAHSDHGKIPIPAPAVAGLLKGFTLYSSDIQAELVTPTGAALLSECGTPVASMPKMILEKIGHGAGSRELPFPNVMRLFLGETPALISQDVVLKLEANLDDMNPQFWENAMDRLHESGAFDAFITPVIMKKSRPAHLLTVLSPPEKEREISRIIFDETTTLGIRKELVPRITLHRRIVGVKTKYGKIPCKIARENGRIVNAAPEYESLKKIAREKEIPLKKLYQEVSAQISWSKKLS